MTGAAVELQEAPSFEELLILTQKNDDGRQQPQGLGRYTTNKVVKHY